MLRTEMTQRFWVKTALSDDFAQFTVTQLQYQLELETVMRHETLTLPVSHIYSIFEYSDLNFVSKRAFIQTDFL